MGGFDRDGYAIIERVLEAARCETIASRLRDTAAGHVGSRNVLQLPWCRELAAAVRAHPEIGPLLPAGAVAVQCTRFDKSPTRNWLVAAHQDLSIPVRERVALPACAGWSRKEGVLYVQPPLAILRTLVAVRVHLDASTKDIGPLRIVPGSHLLGRLDAAGIDEARRCADEVPCLLPRGGALVMRPLLIHASSKVSAAVSRRVLHFVFGPPDLPDGLAWHHAV